MEPINFWNIYVQDIEPADFVWRYGKGDIEAAVETYLQQRPTLFGIVRRGTWKETFKAEQQYKRHCIRTGLHAYLQDGEEEWRPLVEAAREADAKARANAKARAEAEALALAVARVEAEARARAEAERFNMNLSEQDPEHPQPLSDETSADTPCPNDDAPASGPPDSDDSVSMAPPTPDPTDAQPPPTPDPPTDSEPDAGTAASTEHIDTISTAPAPPPPEPQPDDPVSVADGQCDGPDARPAP